MKQENMFFEEQNKEEERFNKKIHVTYGVRKGYLDSDFADKMGLVTKKLLPEISIQYAASPEALETIIHDFLENKKDNTYISYCIQPNTVSYLTYPGSDIELPLPLILPLSKSAVLQQFPEASEEEIKKRIADHTVKKSDILKKINAQIEEEKEWLKDYIPKNKMEKEGIDAIDKKNFNMLSHATAIKIDRKNKVILYKDSYGEKMPEKLEELFRAKLAGYRILHDIYPQQHEKDHRNCFIFATLNLLSFSKMDTIDNTDPFKSFVRLTEENYISFMEETRSQFADIVMEHEKKNTPSV